MKRKRFLRLPVLPFLGICMAGAVLLTACGGRNDPEEPPESVQGSVEGSDETAAAEKARKSPSEGGDEDEARRAERDGAEGPVDTANDVNANSLLPAFCNDDALNAWFDALDENPPVIMTFVSGGEGPWSTDFTDTDLILETAHALQTVKIGELSDINPDNVTDAPGTGYFFTMEDGTEYGFSFELSCFHWKGAWYAVRDQGDLTEVIRTLSRLGNPEYVNVYAKDGGFYTRCPETWDIEWVDEESYWGGLYLYPNGAAALPFIEIRRYADVAETPAEFLAKKYTDYMRQTAENAGYITLQIINGPEEYDIGGRMLSGILYAVRNESGDTMHLLALAMKVAEEMTGEPLLIQFCAGYDASDEQDEQTAMRALDMTVKGFSLKYGYYETHEAQPGRPLIDFCNDDALRAWFAHAKERPLELTIVTDTWYDTSDPEVVNAVLAALQTVRIGDVYEKTVGGADRRLFDFYDMESDYLQSFHFFRNTFSWNGKNYEVLDWGELETLKLRLKNYEITLEP